MVYEKDKIRRLIEYKDKVIDDTIKNDLQWILKSYNEYFINSRDYETAIKERKIIMKKYYNAEEEKENLKEELIRIKRKYKVLKGSCRKLKDMI